MSATASQNGDQPFDDDWTTALLGAGYISIAESLAVSPSRGRLRRGSFKDGDAVAKGAEIGRVEPADGRIGRAVSAPRDGVFLGWLVWEGETVGQGVPLARIGVNGSPTGNGRSSPAEEDAPV